MGQADNQGISACDAVAPEPPKTKRSVKEIGIAERPARAIRTHGNRVLDEDASARESATLPIAEPAREPIVSINGRDVDAREIDKAA